MVGTTGQPGTPYSSSGFGGNGCLVRPGSWNRSLTALAERGLPKTGNIEDLIERLVSADSE
jgi:hypothetical protein